MNIVIFHFGISQKEAIRMEIKNLRYFLAVAREENMSHAAEILHVTQPTLSKVLKSLEDELGKKLFTRHSFSIKLTDEGMLLRDRAEDLVAMADKIEQEFISLDDITGGDTEQVMEKLDKGLLDFGVICETPNTDKYEYLVFPDSDLWGVVMLKTHPLAKKKSIKATDLIGQPLYCSEQSWNIEIPEWAGEHYSRLHLEGSFRLSYNASMFAKEGLGILLTFEHLINCSEESDLVFKPLSPKQKTKLYLIWSKYQTFMPIAEQFLKQVKQSFEL